MFCRGYTPGITKPEARDAEDREGKVNFGGAEDMEETMKTAPWHLQAYYKASLLQGGVKLADAEKKFKDSKVTNERETPQVAPAKSDLLFSNPRPGCCTEHNLCGS